MPIGLTFTTAFVPKPPPIVPRWHDSESSLLRMGLRASPHRLAPVVRSTGKRPFFLQQRTPTTQLDLFGPPGRVG